MREKGPDRWELRVYAGRDPQTGRQITRSRIHRGDKRSASRALIHLEAEVLDDPPPAARGDVDDPTVTEHLDRWHALRAPDWSPTQVSVARGHIDRWITPLIGGLRIAELRARHIDDWLLQLRNHHDLGPAYVTRIHTTLRAALELAVRWELLDRNPAAGAHLPALPHAERKVPGPELLVRALAAAAGDVHTYTLVRLAAATGARRGQLVALQWADVDHDAALITFSRAAAKDSGRGVAIKGTKTGRVIRCPVDPVTLDAVAAYRRHRQAQALAAGVGRLDDASFVFAQDPAGRKCWYPDTATRRWVALTRAVVDGDPELDDPDDLHYPLAGVRLQDLRHAHATLLVAGDVDPVTASGRLGHSARMLLERYAHPVDDRQRAAADLIARHLDGAG